MRMDVPYPRLSRKVNNNNVGIGAPEIDYTFEPGGNWVDITTVHKGGLFGSDYRMLFPGDGIDGIKRFFLDVMYEFGRRGLACQPAIVGVGLGGSKDIAMTLGKQAACLRTVARGAARLRSTVRGAASVLGLGMLVRCHSGTWRRTTLTRAPLGAGMT